MLYIVYTICITTVTKTYPFLTILILRAIINEEIRSKHAYNQQSTIILQIIKLSTNNNNGKY